MGTNSPRKEERSTPNTSTINSSASGELREEQESAQAPSTVVDMHHHFGNTQVQSSLQGHSSSLDVLIHGALGLDASGIGAGEGILSHLGNHGIQRLISRKRLSGGSDGEILPEMSDPNIQRIRTSGGAALPDGLRSTLEGAFQHDFKHVRIHTSGSDASSAEALHAEAFTVENHIYFNSGNFNPHSQKGMELLAHELTHVVQHDEGRLNTSTGVSSPTDSIEVEAVRKGAEIAQQVGTFRPHDTPTSIEAVGDLFSSPVPGVIADQMHDRLQQPEADSQQDLSSAVVAREATVEGKVSASQSLSFEVTFPIYAPFISGTAKVEMNQTNSSSSTDGNRTEVEGVIEGTVNISLLFLTLKFGIELKGKVTVLGNVDPVTAIQKGCKELVAYKMSQDFLPKIQRAKSRIEESYIRRTENAANSAVEIYNNIQNGEWENAAENSAWYNPFNTPVETLREEIAALSQDIRIIANSLGEGKVTQNELYNVEVVNRAIAKVANASTKEEALERYYEFVDIIGDEWNNSRQRVLSQVDQIQCVTNDPSVGFEGSVTFKASGELEVNDDNKAELGVSRVIKIEDKVKDKSFNHETSTATEVFGQVSLAGGQGFGIKCSFDPSWEAPKNIEFEATLQLGEITTDTSQPSSDHAQAFINGINLSGGSLLGSALDTAKDIGKKIGSGLIAQKNSYFSADEVAKRATGKRLYKAHLSVIPKVKYKVGSGSLLPSEGSCTVKFEQVLEGGFGVGKTAGVEIKGSIKRGTSVEVAIQRKEQGTEKTTDIHAAAAQGVSSSGGSLPYAQKIQDSFGRHDISSIRSHQGAGASKAASQIGAKAYATGRDVAFGSSPDLHTSAHEAAHVIQQQGGVSLKGGVGAAGDKYERHADAVADLVVQGKSAEALLDQYSGSSSTETGVQRKELPVQRDGEQAEEGGDVRMGASSSLSGEVTFPIYAPFVTGTVKFTLNQAQTDSMQDGRRTEVEGCLEAIVSLNLLFITIRFAVELRGKVTVQGVVRGGDAVRLGCKELVAYHLSEDFLPKIERAKRRINDIYIERTNTSADHLGSILHNIQNGDWEEAADTSIMGDAAHIFGYGEQSLSTPIQLLRREIVGLSRDIRNIANNLGEGEVTQNELFDMRILNRAIAAVANSSSQEEALEWYYRLQRVVGEEWDNSRRRVLSQIDQIQCVTNDPNVGFEGSVTFRVGAEVSFTDDISGGIGYARVSKIEDEVGETSFNHETTTVSEIFGSFPFPGTDGVEIKCSCDPDLSSPDKMEIELSIKFGEVSTESQEPSANDASSFIQTIRGSGSNIQILSDPRETARRIGSYFTEGFAEAKSAFFDRDAVAERANGSELATAHFTLVPKIKFQKTGESWSLDGGSIALKYEQRSRIGSAFGRDSDIAVSGEFSSGAFVEVSF